MLTRFVTAFTELDVDQLIALMTDDVWVRMPPAAVRVSRDWHGKGFFTAVDAAPTWAPTAWSRSGPMVNPRGGSTAVDPVTGVLHLAGIEVIGLAGGADP